MTTNYAQTPFPVANTVYPGMVIKQTVWEGYTPVGNSVGIVIGKDHYGNLEAEQDFVWVLVANTTTGGFKGDRMVDYANIQSTYTYYDNMNGYHLNGDVWYVTPCSATGTDGANSDNYNLTSMHFSEGYARNSTYNHHGALLFIGETNTAAFEYGDIISYEANDSVTVTAEVQGIFGNTSANLFSEWGEGYAQLPAGWYLSIKCIDGNNPYDLPKGSWFFYQTDKTAFIKDILICPTLRPDSGS